MGLLALEQQGLKATALGSPTTWVDRPGDLQGREEAGRLFLAGLCVGGWYSTPVQPGLPALCDTSHLFWDR